MKQPKPLALPQTGAHAGSKHMRIDRRRFLALSGQGIAGLTLLSQLGITSCTSFKNLAPTQNANNAKYLSVDEWNLISKVQDHLLPSEKDAPGAKEINSIGYLDAALGSEYLSPLKPQIVKEGVPQLQKLSNQEFAKPFQELDEEEREILLRKFEESEDGGLWLTVILTFTMEALVGDPAHGGNTNEIGWRWLEHRPGFPRPPSRIQLQVLS